MKNPPKEYKPVSFDLPCLLKSFFYEVKTDFDKKGCAFEIKLSSSKWPFTISLPILMKISAKNLECSFMKRIHH